MGGWECISEDTRGEISVCSGNVGVAVSASDAVAAAAEEFRTLYLSCADMGVFSDFASGPHGTAAVYLSNYDCISFFIVYG